MYVGKRTIAVLKWKELVDVDKWAEENFILESSSAVGGGKFNFRYAPHLKEPLKMFGEDNIQNITLWLASQAGKSTASYVMINYVIDRLTGANIGFYLPNDQLVSYTATNRIIPSIKRIPSNAKIMKETKENTKLKDNSKIIRIAGGVLRIMGAESATNRKSFPAQFIFMDEIAEFKHEHVLEIEERNKTFSNFGGKIVKLSTSLTADDPIVQSYDNAECQMEYFCKCPKCGKEHIDDFIENVVFPSYDDIEVPEDIREKDKEVWIRSYKAKNALYQCPHCKALWNTDDKQKAVQKGKWKAVRGNPKKESSIAYRASSFVSYFVTLETLAKKWLDVKDATDTIKEKFYNGWLSKIYEPEVKNTPKEEIYKLKSKIPYEKVPDDVIGLVGAVDVQKDHFYLIVVAVDANQNKIITEYKRIETWDILEDNILRPRYKEDGEMVNVEVWGIDSGYNTYEIYDFCDRMNNLHIKAYDDPYIETIFEKRGGEAVNCVPVKGASRKMVGISQITRIERNIEGELYEDTLKLHVINTHMFKENIMNLIDRTIEFKDSGNEIYEIKNSLLIHKDMDDDIARSLTSEVKQEVELKSGGTEWRFVPIQKHPFNHYLDGLVYCLYLIEKMEIKYRELVSKETTAPEVIEMERASRRERKQAHWRDVY